MEHLLKSDYCTFYGLAISTVANISLQTNRPYFELEDDQNKETQIHLVHGMGMAAYTNTNSLEITILNYDKFVTSLPQPFQNGRKRCDIILYTSNNNGYFLLNELKDRKPMKNVRKKARLQLRHTIVDIMAVPAIIIFINGFVVRRCCYFNKQIIPPQSITAIPAFNRINQIASDGIQLSDTIIESYGFELFQYTGNQIFNIV